MLNLLAPGLGNAPGGLGRTRMDSSAFSGILQYDTNRNVLDGSIPDLQYSIDIP